jgi:anti-sigma B factor antagonist
VDLQLSDHEVDSETHLIELGGEIDLYTAPELEERLGAIFEEGKRRVVLDLSEVTFIDASGLRVIVSALQRLRGVGGALALVCVNENVVQAFEITALDKLLPIYETRDEALAAVAEAG